MAENFLKSFSVNNLQLGVACTLMLYLTPIIDRFKELHPSVRLAVREGPSLMLIKDLLDFKYDVCLVGTLREVDRRLQVFRRIPRVEKMVLVASPEYPLACKKKVRWEDLVNYPLIIQSEGSVAREVILDHFKSAGLRPLIGAEVDNVECAKELARQKKGIALMFLPNVKDEVAREKLKVIPVAGGEIRLGIDVVINRETSMSPAIKTFLPVIEEYFNDHSFQQKLLTLAV
jgi:DNA-binding transcriptional LysR family regulator